MFTVHKASFALAIVSTAMMMGCRGGTRPNAGSSRAENRNAAPAGRVTESGAILFEGMGNHQRRANTSSPEAQRFFDQGLTWTFAFNHDEAIRSFKEASRLDPNFPMAYWGIAYCNGPHINNMPMSAEQSKEAWDALQQALARLTVANPTERALIHALSKRYSNPPPEDRGELNRLYSEAMRGVWRTYPQDADVGTLFAESLMNLRPWDLWRADGSPYPETTEVLLVLEEVLRLAPNHPGANHLYIHAVEASPNPERGLASADRLRDMVPASGHLLHMPGHIDARVGGWENAFQCNIRAIESDRRYRALVPQQGFYRVYMTHNHHFLAHAAMMQGRRAEAMKAAEELLAAIPKEWATQNAALIDGFMSIEMDVQMRFGQWDQLLRTRRPSEHFPYSTAKWHFVRGVAHAAKGQIDKAEAEHEAFREAAKRVPAEAKIGNNPAEKPLAIAEHVLAGEIAFRRGSIDQAAAELRSAVAIEDALTYDDPPDWMQPVRHTLGAFLVSAGRHAEAEQVYRDDLKHWPENGWSLFGLSQALKGRGADAEAAEWEARYRNAWAKSDIKIGASCLCVSKG